jgi:DNA uptake protein ComE-like DNA-binding protein
VVLVLLTVLTILLLIPYWFRTPRQPSILPPEIQAYLDAPLDTGFPGQKGKKDTPAHRFYLFDPNTADAAVWRAFGLPEKNIRTLLHYIEKGGRFREPADIRRIWGMPAQLATKLMPYVRIPDQGGSDRKSSARKLPEKKIRPIDINTADIETWEQLPGIGQVLAERICRFRDRLGGFASVMQVGSTYGLRDSVFREIAPYLVFQPATLPGIDLDVLDRYGFQHIFGLDYGKARDIVAWREKHGGVLRKDDIMAIPFLPDSTKIVLLRRMAPAE